MNAQRKDVPEQPSPPVERMAGELLKALVDELRVAGASWQQLSKDQQDSVINRMRSRVRYETEQAITLIAKGSREAAMVAIESVTVKGGAKKAVLIVNDSVHELIDYVGQKAVLVMCDPEQYMGGVDEVEGEDEQGSLPLEDDDQDDDDDEEAVE